MEEREEYYMLPIVEAVQMRLGGKRFSIWIAEKLLKITMHVTMEGPGEVGVPLSQLKHQQKTERPKLNVLDWYQANIGGSGE